MNRYRKAITELQTIVTEATLWRRPVFAWYVHQATRAEMFAGIKCKGCGSESDVREVEVSTLWQTESVLHCAKCFPDLLSQCIELNRLNSLQRPREEQAARLRMRRRAAVEQIVKIPPLFAGTTFKNFFAENADEAKALDQVTKWTKNADARKQYRFLFVSGSPGLGKTHLGIAAYKFLVRRLDVAFWNESVLKNIWLNSPQFANANYLTRGEFLTQVANKEVLILDDLGAANPSEGWSEALYGLLLHRVDSFLPTFITTNYVGSALTNRLQLRTVDRAMSGLNISIEGRSRRGIAA